MNGLEVWSTGLGLFEGLWVQHLALGVRGSTTMWRERDRNSVERRDNSGQRVFLRKKAHLLHMHDCANSGLENTTGSTRYG